MILKSLVPLKLSVLPVFLHRQNATLVSLPDQTPKMLGSKNIFAKNGHSNVQKENQMLIAKRKTKRRVRKCARRGSASSTRSRSRQLKLRTHAANPTPTTSCASSTNRRGSRTTCRAPTLAAPPAATRRARSRANRPGSKRTNLRRSKPTPSRCRAAVRAPRCRPRSRAAIRKRCTACCCTCSTRRGRSFIRTAHSTTAPPSPLCAKTSARSTNPIANAISLPLPPPNVSV
mmetsp:Transcript_14853/g.25498  ORF Transcript_14853/g.25498 Transcript_14853/m.25498 type:complete len:231 (+) Transcript_14853:116-808(+)